MGSYFPPNYFHGSPPILSGNASPADVAKDKTFYSANAETKLTGTRIGPAVFIDVASGRPVVNLNRKNLDNKNVFSV